MFRVKIKGPALEIPYKTDDGRTGTSIKQDARLTWGENTMPIKLPIASMGDAGTIDQEYDLHPDSFTVTNGKLVVASKFKLVPVKAAFAARPSAAA